MRSLYRYNTPFSTVLVSYEKIIDLRTFTTVNITPDITIQLTNQTIKLRKSMQRELDVVGILTVHNKSIPFLILPMTDLTGAHFTKKRIDTEFPTHEFIVDGITVHIEPKVTVSGHNKKLTPDKESYLKAMYQFHCEPKLQ